MHSNQIKINDKVKVTLQSDAHGMVGTVTGIAAKIPTPNSDIMIASFDEAFSQDGATSMCIPYGYLVKV